MKHHLTKEYLTPHHYPVFDIYDCRDDKTCRTKEKTPSSPLAHFTKSPNPKFSFMLLRRTPPFITQLRIHFAGGRFENELWFSIEEAIVLWQNILTFFFLVHVSSHFTGSFHPIANLFFSNMNSPTTNAIHLLLAVSRFYPSQLYNVSSCRSHPLSPLTVA